MMQFLRLGVAAALLCVAANASAQVRPVVVELFTSQGCSSCPPADAYLGQLARRSDVLALALHVGYWDDLGWRDRFALPQSVERQDIYARNLHRSSAYTPQLVIDGSKDDFRTDGQALARALGRNRDNVPLKIDVADAAIQIEVGSRPSAMPCDVVLVSYLRHAVSNVGRGENAGRSLEEFNIVRDIRRIGSWRGDMQTYRVPIVSLPSDATDVAILIQPLGQGRFVGAGSHALR